MPRKLFDQDPLDLSSFDIKGMADDIYTQVRDETNPVYKAANILKTQYESEVDEALKKVEEEELKRVEKQLGQLVIPADPTERGEQLITAFKAGIGDVGQLIGRGIELGAKALKESPLMGFSVDPTHVPALSTPGITKKLMTPLPESSKAQLDKYAELGDRIRKDAEKLSEKNTQFAELKEFEWIDLADPNFYFTKGARTVPLLATLIPTAVAGGAVGSGLATAAGAGALGINTAGAIMSAIFSRPVESAMEALGTYNELTEAGVDPSVVAEESAKVFKKNLGLAGMDAVQWALAFGKIPKPARKGFVRFAQKVAASKTGRAARFAIGAGSEGEEEVIQEYFVDQARAAVKGEADPDFLKALMLSTPEQREVFALGAMTGTIFQTVGEVTTGKMSKEQVDNVIGEVLEGNKIPSEETRRAEDERIKKNEIIPEPPKVAEDLSEMAVQQQPPISEKREYDPSGKAIEDTRILRESLAEDIQPSKLSKEDIETQKTVKKVLDVDLVFTEGMDTANGVVIPEAKGTIFVDRGADNPVMAVIGHEWTHDLKARNKGLYDELLTIADEMDSKGLSQKKASLKSRYTSANKKRAAAGEDPLAIPTQEQITDEIIGDFMGERMHDQSFWERVEARSPQLLQDMIAYMKKVVAKLKGEIPEAYKTGDLFKTKESLEKAINIASNVVAKKSAEAKLAKKSEIKKATPETADSYKEKYANKDGWVTVRVLDPTKKKGTLKRKPYILKTRDILETPTGIEIVDNNEGVTYKLDEVEIAGSSLQRETARAKANTVNARLDELGLKGKERVTQRKKINSESKNFGNLAIEVVEQENLNPARLKEIATEMGMEELLGKQGTDSQIQQIYRDAASQLVFEEFGFKGNPKNVVDRHKATEGLKKKVGGGVGEKALIDTDKYYKAVDRGIFQEIVSKSVQKDGQKLLDAIDSGDIDVLNQLILKYQRDAGISQGGGGVGPKKTKQARHGTAQLFRLATDAIKELKGKLKEASEGKALEEKAIFQLKDTYFSQLTKSVEDMTQKKAPPSQWMAVIRKQPGVKKEEIEWSGLEEWLSDQKGSVGREDVVNYLKANEIKVTETELADIGTGIVTTPNEEEPNIFEVFRADDPKGEFYGTLGEIIELPDGTYKVNVPSINQAIFDTKIEAEEYIKSSKVLGTQTKFGQYTTPGGQTYRELLLTLPQPKINKTYNEWLNENYTGVDSKEARELYKIQIDPDTPNFTSSHFDQPNVLAHIRFDERTDSEGRKVLHIAEIQSDWHQKGRKKGYMANDAVGYYGDPKTNDWVLTDKDENEVGRYRHSEFGNGSAAVRWHNNTGVPNAPFKTTWPLLAMKRMIRYAAENGFDAVTWDTGEIQAERYDLSKQLDKVVWNKSSKLLYGYKSGDELIRESNVTEANLADYVGKEAAKKLSIEDLERTTPQDIRTISGLDLKVGGEGMAAFYDKMLPSMINKYVKKWGGRVQPVKISIGAKYAAHSGNKYVVVDEQGLDWFSTGSRESAQKELERMVNANPDGLYRVVENIESNTAHSLTITPQMKEAALAGQPLFQLKQSAFTKGEEKKEIKSKAFLEHLDYFGDRILPEDSKIRTLKKRIQRINGLRLSGKITTQEANRRARGIHRELIQTAQAEGVSIRTTRGGKSFVSVRKSGVYVPEEFSKYDKFKDVKPTFGGGNDLTRFIQEIDGSLTVKQKAKMKGQAGQVEQNILWPSRDISIQKMKWLSEKQAELKILLAGIKPSSKKDIAVTDVLRVISSGDNIETALTKSQTKDRGIAAKAVRLRDFYDTMLDEQNVAREMRNQPLIPFRRDYSPEMLRDATIWERVFNRKKDPNEIIKDKTLPDYIRPNKPFNPRELANEHGIPYEEQVKSAVDLASKYMVTASKDIFNTSIIENNKAFIQQMEALELNNAAQALGQWTAETYAGLENPMDKAIPKKMKSYMRKFNQIRNMAVFPFNYAWSLVTQPSSFAFTAMRYKPTNVLKGMYDWAQPEIRRQAAEDYYSFIVKTTKEGRLSRQDAENLIGGDVRIYESPVDMLHDVSTLLLDQIERLLTGISIRAAYHEGKSRGLKGAALRQFASDGGAKTQSMYNDEDKPRILKSLGVKTAAPFQTFAFEVKNTIREVAGKTGTPPSTQMERIMWGIRFTAAASVFQAFAKWWLGKEVWNWRRPPLPFAEFWLNPIIDKLSGTYSSGTRNLPSPVSTATRVSKGINDYLVTGDTRKFRNEFIKYAPGFFNIPGGVQISRLVDATIAYSEGGIYDRKGRLMFPIETDDDLIKAVIGGVWATKGGQEWLKKRKPKKSPIEIFIERQKK